MFKKATKTKARLRLAIVGPSGSGKTYSALAIGTRLGSKVAVIDSERGSASKYAGVFAFDVVELTTFGPDVYVSAIRAAAQAGYDVLVIDSLSHAWMGKDGALERVDKAAKREPRGNSFAAWRDVTPQHNALVDAILAAPMHVVVTMRAKTEYVLEEDSRGKKVPRKVGMAPVQRDGVEYEFDVVADMNLNNEFVVSKTRCPALAGQVFDKPGEDVAAILRAWLSDGAEAPAPAPTPIPGYTPMAETVNTSTGEVTDFFDSIPTGLLTDEQIGELTNRARAASPLCEAKLLAAYRVGSIEEIPASEYDNALARIEKFAAAARAKK